MPDIEFNWRQLYEKLKEQIDIKAIEKELDDLKHAKFYYIPREFLDVVTVTVITAEKVFAGISGLSGGGGEEKRKAVVAFLDDIIKLPFFLDKAINLDGVILGYLVDYAVALWNKIYGHKWAEVVPFPPADDLGKYYV